MMFIFRWKKLGRNPAEETVAKEEKYFSYYRLGEDVG